ncbi:hypothetical protein HPP92_004415 [Vanilla planifolia]|uniref:FAD-binding domain-containing protein n=1 Tax=Vanilla planifolia TaxID=51239 RepID=A0A835S1Q1_VANPL|nr:hypothetical protein HPP92_004415 [Vanilla planifolia]
MATLTAAARKVEDLVIVGGGIAGVATALGLLRIGKRSLVLERWHELRESGASLTLGSNAWRALDALGVAHKLLPRYYLLKSGIVTNLETGVTQHQPFVQQNGEGDEIGPRVVHRRALLEAIAEELPPDAIRFSSKLTLMKTEQLPDSSTVYILQLEDGAIIKAKAVIGCDGVHSVVAQWLGLAAPRDSGRSAVRGLTSFPEGHGFIQQVHQFLFKEVRAGFVPVNENDVYWFVTHLTTAKVQEMGSDPELIRRATLEDLAVDFPAEFQEIVRRSKPDSLSWARLLYRAPWNVLFGRTHRGCVTVAGDAMHPTMPDLGQGGCIALEDAVVLARCVARAGTAKEMEEGMARYVAERRWRVAWVITASFLSGYVQQASTGLWARGVKLIRDRLFYTFIFPKIIGITSYNCGTLTKAI